MNRFKLLSASLLLQAKISPAAIAAQFKSNRAPSAGAPQYISPENIKIATLQMALQPYHSLREYLEHLHSLVQQGAQKGAQLICFPEFTGLLPLLISMTHYDACLDLADALLSGDAQTAGALVAHYQEYLAAPLFDCYYNVFSLLAHHYQVYLMAGSAVIAQKEGLYNRSFLFAPSGDCILEQDKLYLTPLEEQLGFVPGQALEVAPTPLGRLAVLPGKDSRTFEPAKVAAAQGAQILLCPWGLHHTHSLAFYQSGPFMRCQEQQVFAAVSSLVGDFDHFTFRGQSGIYGPYEASRTGTGVLAQSPSLTEENVLISRVNLERLNRPMNLRTADVNPALYQQLKQAYASLKTQAVPPPPAPEEEKP